MMSHQKPWGEHLMKKNKDFEKHFGEIQNLLNCPGSKTITDKIRDEHIVMFIGNTKSGKSTLVNFAIGNQLKAVKKNIKLSKTMSIAKVNEQDEGPVIGLESVSETTLPTVWTARESGIREKVVDAPGFEDNRGVVQDIANAFYIKEIIRNAKSVKFVLVTDINDIINDNIGSFINFIDKISKIFPETRVLEGGIVLIFSKTSEDTSPHEICEFFQESILKQEKINLPNKSLLKYFVQHRDCITFLNKPVSEGTIMGSTIGGLLNLIENRIIGIPGEEMSDVKPGISDKSRVLLLSLHTEFCNVAEYLAMLERLKNVFAKRSKEVYEIESIDEVSKMDEVLQGLEQSVEASMSQGEADSSLGKMLLKITDLGKIGGADKLTEDGTIDVKLQFVEFVDETLDLDNSAIYREKFLGTVEMIRNELHLARLLAATRLNKMSAEQAEREKRELERKHEEEMRKYAEKVKNIEEENKNKAEEQLKNMGVFDHLAEAGKKAVGNIKKHAEDAWSAITDWFSWN